MFPYYSTMELPPPPAPDIIPLPEGYANVAVDRGELARFEALDLADYGKIAQDRYATHAYDKRLEGRTCNVDIGKAERPPGQNRCNWPCPDWAVSRQLRYRHLNETRRRLNLIYTGSEIGEVYEDNLHTYESAWVRDPRTWYWCDYEINMSGPTPLYIKDAEGRFQPQPMPAILIEMLEQIPQNAWVSYELSPYVQTATSSKTDYTPPMGNQQYGLDGTLNEGWRTLRVNQTQTGFGNRAWKPGRDGRQNYREDCKGKRSVGKFVSGGRLTVPIVPTQWRSKTGPKPVAATPALAKEVARRDHLINEGFQFYPTTSPDYVEAFSPLCGVLMTNYHDVALKAGGSRVRRTQQACFHPHPWKDANVFGPAVTRLMWMANGAPTSAARQEDSDTQNPQDQLNQVLENNWRSATKKINSGRFGISSLRLGRDASKNFWNEEAASGADKFSASESQIHFGASYPSLQRALNNLEVDTHLSEGWKVADSHIASSADLTADKVLTRT